MKHQGLIWGIISISLGIIVLMPVLVLVISWFSDQSEIWNHLLETQMSRLLINTGILLFGVALGVIVIGVSTAWLVSMCEFPGRRILDWALILPMAIPAYVLAFVFLGVMDYAGPVQSMLRSLLGEQMKGFSVQGHGSVIFVLTLVFYPYVYLLARSAFVKQGRHIMDTSRSLGATPFESFFSVSLPMARPAIVAGMSLALMETLADFGAVAVFNYDTFTTAIYKSWFGFFNFQAAAQLATLLLLFVFLALLTERRARGNAVFAHKGRHHRMQPYLLTGIQAWLAFSLCMMVVLLAFMVPVLQLLIWIWQQGVNNWHAEYWQLLMRTLWLGAIAACLCLVLAFCLAYGQRYRNLLTIISTRIATIGYALPGTVLAIAIVWAARWLDITLIAQIQTWLSLPVAPVLGAGMTVLLIAYVIRFLAVAFNPIEAGLLSIRPSIQEAAQNLGANQQQSISKIYLPMLKPGIITALLMVFVDVMKEMPATLLIRPFGWDTLAVHIYGLTSEGEWQRAAMPSLTLVLIGLIPVILLMGKSRQHLA